MVFRPPFIKQLDGSRYAGLNCTMASAAMAAIRHKVGSNPPGTALWYPKPWSLRALTGDTSGGTTLGQADTVLNRYYGIDLIVIGNDTWDHFREKLRAGCGAILQISYSQIYNTKWSGSPTFKGNHAVYVNEVRRNYKLDRWEYLVYDPLCDGRRSGVDQAPSWIPESVLKRAAGYLYISPSWGRAGVGRCWAAYTRDTEPAIRLVSGAKRYPYGPRTFYARVDGVKVRNHTYVGDGSDIVKRLDKGQRFEVAQMKAGEEVNGSVRWYGNYNGTQWVNATALRTTRP
jgi:hypothetical protein